MDISHFVSLENRQHILSAMEKGCLFGGDIWQCGAGRAFGTHICSLVQTTLDLTHFKALFRAPEKIELDGKEALLIRLNYRSLVFRLNPGDYFVLGESIVCKIPDQASALAERSGGDRYLLPSNSGLSLSLKRLERCVKEMTYEMEMRIIDVSLRGFGIMISASNRDYFVKNDYFWLRAVDHRPLRSPILGSVKYVAPQGSSQKRGDVRVGLSLELPLSQEILFSLKNKSILVLSA